LTESGHVIGTPRVLLRAEGLAVAVATGLVLWQIAPPWWLVGLGLLAPDLALAGKLAGPRVGAAVYNAAHTYLGPLLLAAIWGLAADVAGTVGTLALLWAMHIGIDRALGFGLKYPTGFRDTHLGRFGQG
jgi:hypothetical protein